jgi:hypothetical protein
MGGLHPPGWSWASGTGGIEDTVLHHNTHMILRDRAGRDVEVAEDLVQLPATDELDGGIVRLVKKECHGTAGP